MGSCLRNAPCPLSWCFGVPRSNKLLALIPHPESASEQPKLGNTPCLRRPPTWWKGLAVALDTGGRCKAPESHKRPAARLWDKASQADVPGPLRMLSAESQKEKSGVSWKTGWPASTLITGKMTVIPANLRSLIGVNTVGLKEKPPKFQLIRAKMFLSLKHHLVRSLQTQPAGGKSG